MDLSERISLIIKENNLKQKELAAIMGVTDSYISSILARRNLNLSTPVASLIGEKFGYNVQWVLSGAEPKYKQVGKSQSLSDTHKKVIFQAEKLSEGRAKAVLAFINSLEEIEKHLQQSGDDE